MKMKHFKKEKKNDIEKKKLYPTFTFSYLARDILTHFLSRNSFTPFFLFPFFYYHRVIIRVFLLLLLFFLQNSDEMKIFSALNFSSLTLTFIESVT